MTSTKKSGVFVDEASLKKTLDALEKLPSGMRRNAMAGATMAGAKVIVKLAKMKAPICLAGTIKARRGKQRTNKLGGKSVVVHVTAGNPRGGLGTAVSKVNRVMKNAGQSGLSAAQKRSMNALACPPAIWFELGTYSERNEAYPYLARTKSQMRKYGNGIRASYNQYGGVSPMLTWKKKSELGMITPHPFMRPAMSEGYKNNSVQRAMGKKLDDYIKKQGV